MMLTSAEFVCKKCLMLSCLQRVTECDQDSRRGGGGGAIPNTTVSSRMIFHHDGHDGQP